MVGDEAGVDALVAEFRLAEQGAQEPDVGGQAVDGELVEGAQGAVHCHLEVAAAAGHLHQQRVEVRGDRGAHGDVAVETHARATRGLVAGDHAGVGAEAVGRVLGGDAALQRSAVEFDEVLGEVDIFQRSASSDVHLVLHDVDAGDFLRDRVLDLHTRVHLDEDVVAGLVHEELDGAGALVVDFLAEIHRVLADALALLFGDVLGRGDLHDLLVAALHGAVALEEVDHVAVRVGHDLHLDVLRVDHRALDVDVRVAERGFRLAGSLRSKPLDVLRLLNEAHATPAAAGDGLDEHGELELLGVLRQLLRVCGRLRVLQHRQARPLRCMDRGRLIAGEVEGLRGRADELDAVVAARAGELGALGEEPVAGVHRVRTSLLCRPDDFVDVQVGLDRLARLADLDCLVSERAVEGVAVFAGVDGNRLRAGLKRCSERTHGDLAAVCHQDLVKAGKVVQRKIVRVHRAPFAKGFAVIRLRAV